MRTCVCLRTTLCSSATANTKNQCRKIVLSHHLGFLTHFFLFRVSLSFEWVHGLCPFSHRARKLCTYSGLLVPLRRQEGTFLGCHKFMRSLVFASCLCLEAHLHSALTLAVFYVVEPSLFSFQSPAHPRKLLSLFALLTLRL